MLSIQCIYYFFRFSVCKCFVFLTLFYHLFWKRSLMLFFFTYFILQDLVLPTPTTVLTNCKNENTLQSGKMDGTEILSDDGCCNFFSSHLICWVSPKLPNPSESLFKKESAPIQRFGSLLMRYVCSDQVDKNVLCWLTCMYANIIHLYE